ncbi:hypothetical protein KFE25_012857 [Diacronema lutheri]|uniref:L-2-hydroxyglutarate dehydrogenase, mitochondrial n=1 Tax=Diacronema lutheri TaxID=2081491 RepID=A0A8J5XA74_DIALT|nr:hypothetical protein KFE25_012857 [Diacronema lutheri]
METQTLVVGAGVVGLATAAALARRGRSVLIVERELAIGTGVSSRSSEVVHAGLYYAPGSLKARLCVRGNALLYTYAESRGVGHRRVGKLIVAANELQRRDALPALRRRAEANGVPGVRALSRADARALEPEVECAGALLSESSGIVDSHALMLALLADAERDGATLALGAEVVGAGVARGGRLAVRLRVRRAGGRERARSEGGPADSPDAVDHAEPPIALECAEVVNCTGLSAVRLGAALGHTVNADGADGDGGAGGGGTAAAGACAQLVGTFARGCYFALRGRAPFSHLVYPLPAADLAGLGVHATVDLGGRVRFGPDAEWLGERGVPLVHPDDDPHTFAVDPARADAFYAAIRSYWPALPDDALVPDYAGVRPKLSRQGEPAADFWIARDSAARPQLWHLAGIESPGLTSCLAIGDEVAARVTGGVEPRRAWHE